MVLAIRKLSLLPKQRMVLSHSIFIYRSIFTELQYLTQNRNPTIRASLAPRHALFLAIFSQGQSGVRWHPVTHYFWSFGAECAARARGKRPTERQIKGDIRKITRSLKTIPLQTNSYIFKC